MAQPKGGNVIQIRIRYGQILIKFAKSLATFFFFFFYIEVSISLQKEMATYSSILAWKIPWTEEEPGRLQSMGSQRVGHN